MSWMFNNDKNLASIKFSPSLFNTSNVIDMNHMFEDCHSLTSVDVSHFDTANVRNMSYMFDECIKLTAIDVSHFNTAKVSDMTNMFAYCESLTSLDVTNFNTAAVGDVLKMFWQCSNLTSLDLHSFNTRKVSDYIDMFQGCDKLAKLDLSSFDMKISASTIGDMLSDLPSLEVLILGRRNDLNIVNNFWDGGLGNNHDGKEEDFWVNMGVNKDNGGLQPRVHSWTGADLMKNYDGSKDYDVYVNINKIPNPCGITINYQFEDDKTAKLSPNDYQFGTAGKDVVIPITARKLPTYKLAYVEINGNKYATDKYEDALSKLKFTNDPQTVTFGYEKSNAGKGNDSGTSSGSNGSDSSNGSNSSDSSNGSNRSEERRVGKGFRSW